MTSPIDPIRRAGGPRRVEASKVQPAERAFRAADRNLPAVLENEPEAETEPPPPPRSARPSAAAAFAAHLMGQEGQKRGLRGGPPTLDAAKSSYIRTQWSGAGDRRSRSGRGTKTEI